MNIEDTLPGRPFPLGAEPRDNGVNFAVFSRNGTKVIINLFQDAGDKEPYATIELHPETNKTGDVWHVFVPGLKPGAMYLYQVDGPFNPSAGHRFNAKDFLLDPYAKALTPESIFLNLPSQYRPPVDASDIAHAECRHPFNFPKCVVVDDSDFDWEGDKPINRPLHESIIYEVHAKGFTAGKDSGVQNPGTYAGFIEKIPYLRDLGITAVEMLPLFEFDEFENTNVNPRTGERMKNYWGYSTTAFFAPKAGFAADKTPGGVVTEFKRLVKELHKAGIEIILDVVFNHTAEGNEHGAAISFRGFENSVYYMLVGSHKEYYMNYSGCGNTFNCNHPVVRSFVIDCLHHWVLDYHIDGFRFDLASILTRTPDGSIPSMPALTQAISEDPILAKTKIIAEPWDAGGAYHVGCFPGGRWAEWNDKFRDEIRRFWRGDEQASTSAATRISGSSDLYSLSGRSPGHSINFVSCHDGFTMNDLVSYNHKHNDENGEENRDGTDSNWSYNHGYEGPTANPFIEKMRNKQMKNFILTLLISQGTPMILGGDEFRRSQNGNNNAYCQDNEMSWFDWSQMDKNKSIFDFTKKAIQLRKNHAAFRRSTFFMGQKAGSVPDIQWYNADGSNPDWNDISRFLAFCLFGQYCKNKDGREDNDFYIAANTDRQDIMVTIPTPLSGKKWYLIADTSDDSDKSLMDEEHLEQLREQEHYVIPANSLIILIAK